MFAAANPKITFSHFKAMRHASFALISRRHPYLATGQACHYPFRLEEMLP